MEGNGFECPAQALRWGGMGRGIQTRVVLGFDGWRVALAREEMPSGYRWYLTTMVPPEPESSRDYASNNVKIPGIRVPAGQASGFRVMDVFA